MPEKQPCLVCFEIRYDQSPFLDVLYFTVNINSLILSHLFQSLHICPHLPTPPPPPPPTTWSYQYLGLPHPPGPRLSLSPPHVPYSSTFLPHLSLAAINTCSSHFHLLTILVSHHQHVLLLSFIIGSTCYLHFYHTCNSQLYLHTTTVTLNHNNFYTHLPN